jgi:hypothetical protein
MDGIHKGDGKADRFLAMIRDRRYDLGMTGARWLELARAALVGLGLE